MEKPKKQYTTSEAEMTLCGEDKFFGPSVSWRNYCECGLQVAPFTDISEQDVNSKIFNEIVENVKELAGAYTFPLNAMDEVEKYIKKVAEENGFHAMGIKFENNTVTYRLARPSMITFDIVIPGSESGEKDEE